MIGDIILCNFLSVHFSILEFIVQDTSKTKPAVIEMSRKLTYKNPTKFLFNDEKTCDVKFSFPGVNGFVHAHSSILYIECPKLYKLVRGTVHGECLIQITDTSAEAFRELLRFIYTNVCGLEFDRFIELLELANRFEMPDLLKYLSDAVNKIGLDNVLDLFRFCLYNDTYKEVEEKVVDYVSTNYSQIIKSAKFERISREVLYAVLKLESKDQSFRSEMEVFDAVQRHLLAKKADAIVMPMKEREYLGEIVTLIRFPTMTMKEFTTCLSKCDTLLSSEESLSIVMEINEGICNKFGFSNQKRCGKNNTRNAFGRILNDNSQSKSIDTLLAPTLDQYDYSGIISLQPKQTLVLEKLEIYSLTKANKNRFSVFEELATFTVLIEDSTSMITPVYSLDVDYPSDNLSSTFLITPNFMLNANGNYKMTFKLKYGGNRYANNINGMGAVNRPGKNFVLPHINIISKNSCLRSITFSPK